MFVGRNVAAVKKCLETNERRKANGEKKSYRVPAARRS